MNSFTTRPRTARRIGQKIAVAATAGLALTLTAPAAFAASDAQGTDRPTTVVVSAEAEWTFAATEVRGEKPAPVVERATDTASRSSERTSTYTGTDPRSIASAMVADRGWGSGQFDCLDSLWQKESNWNPYAENASSGAYGIPQSLPGSKMGSVASDWRTNPVTQITWGLNYIEGRYGNPCSAWAHSQAVNWY